MSDNWKEQLDSLLDEIAPRMIALRRHLHAHPDPSGREQPTTRHLVDLLRCEDVTIQPAPDGCGLVADCQSTDLPAGSVRVAVRADIDALRIQDEKQVAYRSTHDGIMHACGHDAHTAIAYGVTLALSAMQASDAFPWPVYWRTVFQPAEETATGARQMITHGAMADVARVFALHVDPTRRTGQVGLRAGAMTASCDALELLIHGQGGHAARPHESKDPIAAAAQLISTLYQFIPRTSDSHDAVVLTMGCIRGGQNPNVIPDLVTLQGTLRTLDTTVRNRTIAHITQVARGMAEITGTTIDTNFSASIPSVRNDAELTRLVWHSAEEVVGSDNVQLITRPSMGSEDFACYLEHCPGVMFRLGAAHDLAAPTPLHTPRFDVDERALVIGARILARAAITASPFRPDTDRVAY
jgi:amidohydrolase